MQKFVVWGLAILLLMPVYASAQTPDRITLLDNFGEYDYGEPLFIYGNVANLLPDSFLIMQIVNPEGDLCQIQQLIPMSNGVFLSDSIPLEGRICGLPGEYEVKLFYGDYSTNAFFSVSSTEFNEPTNEEKTIEARILVTDFLLLIDDTFGLDSSNQIDVSQNNIDELEKNYVDLWSEFYSESFLFEITPIIRPVISSSLDSIESLLENNEISFEIAKSIESSIFSAIFYYEIGDKKRAIDILSDAFVDIQNVNPEKTPAKRAPSFDELEESLLNLMKKSDTVMNRTVKEQIGFIFARGTAPVYSGYISDLIDLLSKARFLDIVSRNESTLYGVVNSDWESLKPSLQSKDTIEELLESKDRVSSLYDAAILLRELDNVERFISSDNEDNSDLANLIAPDWNNLSSDLELASSVSDILESETEIRQMKQIVDISSRLSNAVEISKTSGLSSPFVDDWESLLSRVGNADSPDEILGIVSEFDASMNELREKRNPLSIMKFEYQSMKEKAELQADYRNLFLINNALKILNTAEKMNSGNPSVMRIDRIEVLLTWVNSQAPKIKSDLDSYDQDALKVRASDILQRAKSLENLVDLSLRKNKFLPGYVDFTESFNEEIDQVRDLVIANDLDAADRLVRELFDEWKKVSKAYEDDPYGSDVGYSGDELIRIDYREKLENLSNVVNTFYNSGFAAYAEEYNQMTSDAYELIEIGNFVDAESKILEIAEFLSEYLVMTHPSIIYDINYDPEKDIWIIHGSVEKSIFDRRENLYVTIYNMDGTSHSSLEFTDTKHGDFYTQWIAPTEPGLYVVELQFKNTKATQIVNVSEQFENVYTPSDLNMVDLARDFEELQTFIEKFSGEPSVSHPKISSLINEIKLGLANRDAEQVDDKLNDLKYAIERYLPIRSRSAVVEVNYENDELIVAGAVQKTLAFREDLFVDVYDQRGNLVEEIALKDNSSGLFNEVLSKPFESGTYVAQLQYHDVVVTDFFNVR
ncbi:hypothetical protein [Nitrosopumilus sp. K4]|uniref:hypothetical protein n=1 Tax=Nitrosopumilus sp. K4 TaxID=2795383 RepID=UPI002012C842|nr:hypothetical protein [Nitrosopumilus sp. K4]